MTSMDHDDSSFPAFTAGSYDNSSYGACAGAYGNSNNAVAAGTYDNGIEAEDLCSLLERFEEVESDILPTADIARPSEVRCIDEFIQNTGCAIQTDIFEIEEPWWELKDIVSSSSDLNEIVQTATVGPYAITNVVKCESMAASFAVEEIPTQGFKLECPLISSANHSSDPTTSMEQKFTPPNNCENRTITDHYKPPDDVLFEPISSPTVVEEESTIIPLPRSQQHVVSFDQKLADKIRDTRRSSETTFSPIRVETSNLKYDSESSSSSPSESSESSDFSGDDGNNINLDRRGNHGALTVGEKAVTGVKRKWLFGPHRQQARCRRIKQEEEEANRRTAPEEQYYDRLPSYYTLFSLPNRSVTGLKVSPTVATPGASMCFPRHERDPSPTRLNPSTYSKVPSYYSCFANSTKYDLNEAGGGCSEGRDTRERAHSPKYSVDLLKPRTYRRRSRPALGSPTSGTDEAVVWREFIRSPSGRRRCQTRSDRKLRNKLPVPERDTPELRRILHICRIPVGYTDQKLRQQFGQFGEIENSSVHFREWGDNYAFITFKSMESAALAMDRGNSLPGCSNFDICFGGRRMFCRMDYTDLDGKVKLDDDLVAPSSSAWRSSNETDQCDYQQLLMNAVQGASSKVKGGERSQ